MALDPLTAISAGTEFLGAGLSFVQNLKANRERKRAERAASRAIDSAKKTLKVNRLEGVQLPMDAYNEAFRANVANQKQTLEALMQSDPRLAAAAAGRVVQQGQRGNEMVRQQMGRDIYGREQAIAREDARIDQQLAAIDLEEATGAQIAAENYQEQAAMTFEDMISGFTGTGMTILEDLPLYKKKKNKPIDPMEGAEVWVN